MIRKPKLLLVANLAKEHVLKFHVPTIKMLAENGWTVDVACAGGEVVPYCHKQYHMSYKRSPFSLKTFKGIKELTHIINQGDYDIVYCHTPVGGVVARIAARKARKKNCKVIYFAHGYHFYKGAPLKNWLVFYPVEKILSKITDSIILINKEDYNLTKKKFKNCRAYILNGMGVDFKRFKVEEADSVRSAYRRDMNIPNNAVVLIYLAELIKNKNQFFLLEVLKELLKTNDNIYVVLAGIDHSNGKVLQYAEKLGVSEHVRFLGWRDDIADLYAMSDICTATSIREGFGLNLVEAMVCGVPVVASKNRGHETIIKNGKNGFLVPQGDRELFVKRIQQLISDKELRNKLIQNGLMTKEKYSGDIILNNIKNILEEHLED